MSILQSFDRHWYKFVNAKQFKDKKYIMSNRNSPTPFHLRSSAADIRTHEVTTKRRSPVQLTYRDAITGNEHQLSRPSQQRNRNHNLDWSFTPELDRPTPLRLSSWRFSDHIFWRFVSKCPQPWVLHLSRKASQLFLGLASGCICFPKRSIIWIVRNITTEEGV